MLDARAARHDRRRSAAALLALALVATAPRATAAEAPAGALVPELSVGAGYDDNLFLDAFPAGPMDARPTADAIFDVEPRLLARIGVRGHALSLSIDDLERFTVSSGHLRDLDLRLGYRSTPLGPVELFGGVAWEHWDATLYPDDRSEAAVANVAARIAVRGPLEALIALRGAVRRYPTRGQTDGEVRPSLIAFVRLPARVTIEASYAYLHLASTEPRAALDRHTLGAGVAARPLDWLGLRADYAFGAQQLPGATLDASGAAGARDDLRHELHLLATARPLRWLEAYVEYDFLASTSDAPFGRFRRNQVVAGLTAWGVFSRTLRAPLTPQVSGTRVTFRYRGKATRVSVVGDWNGWDADASPLALEGGVFIGTHEVPPGRHLYALSVDGVVEPPPEASAYVSDEYGGRNGIVVVR